MSFRGDGDFRIAIVVDPMLPIGFLSNTVAAIGIGIGAAQPGFGGVELVDHSGNTIVNSSDRPVPILQADEERMQSLIEKFGDRPDSAIVIAFPAFARSLHSFADYEAAFPACTLSGEKIDGIGISGPSKWIKSLTGSFKLLRK